MRLRNAVAARNWRRPRRHTPDLGLQASRAVQYSISAGFEPQVCGHLSRPQDTDRGGDAVEEASATGWGPPETPLLVITLVRPGSVLESCARISHLSQEGAIEVQDPKGVSLAPRPGVSFPWPPAQAPPWASLAGCLLPSKNLQQLLARGARPACFLRATRVHLYTHPGALSQQPLCPETSDDTPACPPLLTSVPGKVGANPRHKAKEAARRGLWFDSESSLGRPGAGGRR